MKANKNLNSLFHLVEGTSLPLAGKTPHLKAIGSSNHPSSYSFDFQSRFVIENFQQSKPFSSFLPGIAGLKGIPLWLFYVNRGQGVASFGTRDKDGAILEFLPADKAYRQVSLTGFRTFLKEKNHLYEPFSSLPSDLSRSRFYIQPHEFEIEEENPQEGWKTNVVYFTLPNEPFAALVRKVTFKNLSSATRHLEVLDGLPCLLPSGLMDRQYKEFGYTLQSWMEVYNLEEDIPFYKLRASFVDQTEVEGVQGGNFYLSYLFSQGRTYQLKPLVDQQVVFGQNLSLSFPESFSHIPLKRLQGMPQKTVNHVPCGFFGEALEIPGGGEISLLSFIGHVDDIQTINRRKEELGLAHSFEKIRRENKELLESVTQTIQCQTALPELDAYARQTYLDNLIRGGVPVFLGDSHSPKIFYVYSRKHGDLERDYNFFTLAPEYYSQGNGGYRDVNQNRRMDLWFNPKVGDFNLHYFFNLIQTDGYNPFVVKGCSYSLPSKNLQNLVGMLDEVSQKKMSQFFQKPFTPGQLLAFLVEEGIKPPQGGESFFQEALAASRQSFEAEFKEGYWTDHWAYNLDLLENYLSIYPDQEENLLFKERQYRYYDSAAVVKPRSEKTALVKGFVYQLDSVAENDGEKAALIKERREDAHWMRFRHGKGDIYETSLYTKLANLAALKFATLDPLGIGIEMEANKPGWNDSLNGLPALFGSSVAETFELRRLLLYLQKTGERFPGQTVSLPAEVYGLLQGLHSHLRNYRVSDDFQTDHLFWDQMASEREVYRARTKLGFSGDEKEVPLNELSPFWEEFLAKVDAGLERSLQWGQGIYPTYLRFEAEKYMSIFDKTGRPLRDEKGRSLVQVLRWKPMGLPLFLEGPARAIKAGHLNGSARLLYQKVKASALYDGKLKMYKICEPLSGQSMNIGRARSFTPGWLENESIFLHMEYKYLLALLKAGLYDEFFSDIKTALIPFLNPETYGRSPLENSSFLVSSAYPDDSLHGAGFSARLSGSSAEFLNMWTILMAGSHPFSAKDGQLELKLSPILPGWLFNENGQVTFKLFGSCDVTYHNPSRQDTFGNDKNLIERMVLEDQSHMKMEVEGGILKGDMATAVREGQIIKIDVYFKS